MKKFIFGFVAGVGIAVSVPAMAQMAMAIASNARDDADRANRRLDALENLLKVDCTKTKETQVGDSYWTQYTRVDGYCVKRK